MRLFHESFSEVKAQEDMVISEKRIFLDSKREE